MNMTWLESYFKGDRTIWVIVMMLAIMSMLAVYSSTGTLAYKYQSGNTEFYLIRHFSILVLGFVVMYFCHLLKYTVYARFSKIGLFVAAPLLLFTLLMGSNINEANRWITLPIINLSFQTSDMAKVALILYISRVLSQKQDNIKDFKKAFLPVVWPVLLVCGLILPANFSTAAVLFTTSLVIMFIGRISLKYIAGMIGVAVVVFGLFLGISYLIGYEGRITTWKARMENFWKGDSEGNYQVEQAKIAVATGGLLGKGPGNSTQRNFLPHPYSDFIFAIIVEEYGLIGGAGVVFLYLLLFYRAIMIVNRTGRAFAALVTIGSAFSLVFQALINMAVAVNLFPVTGQPLPMLSMGGTSIWFTSFALGVILSVSGEPEFQKNEKEPELAIA
jgi:cell division protein FtsW